jgi:hypothetical protein
VTRPEPADGDTATAAHDSKPVKRPPLRPPDFSAFESRVVPRIPRMPDAPDDTILPRTPPQRTPIE